MDKTEAMIRFINTHNSKDVVVKEIEEIKVQDYDGAEGYIGENYIVKFKGKMIFFTSDGDESIERNGKVAVNKVVFDAWYKKDTAVKFID